MRGPRIGTLCSGYGGLDQGAQAALGGHTVWVSDIDKGANKILAHRYGDLPNLGDFTKCDWSTVEPIDILTAGFPCQPVSNAGKQLGDEDERWLWDDVARAVRELRPGLVLLENVRGLLTAGSGRLFGRVLGALAHLGYDTQWHGLRAADIGAPHGRWRVFIVATDARSLGHKWAGSARDGRIGPADGSLADVAMLPTPQARYGPADGNRNDPNLSAIPLLLPTPAVNDMGEGKTVDHWDEWTAKMKAAHGNGNGHGASLAIEAQRLLATPRAFGSRTSRHAASTAYRRSAPSLEQQVEIAEGITPREVVGAEVQASWSAQWGDYAAAIARWETALGRPAPAPTMTSTKGNPQLSPAFVEWLMGLPAGWVDDVPGLSRNEKLKALGNGVVPQQAAEALCVMASWAVAA